MFARSVCVPQWAPKCLPRNYCIPVMFEPRNVWHPEMFVTPQCLTPRNVLAPKCLCPEMFEHRNVWASKCLTQEKFDQRKVWARMFWHREMIDPQKYENLKVWTLKCFMVKHLAIYFILCPRASTVTRNVHRTVPFTCPHIFINLPHSSSHTCRIHLAINFILCSVRPC